MTLRRTLDVVVCGAGPAKDVATLIRLARSEGCQVRVIATPSAMEFLDVPVIEGLVGQSIRHSYRSPGQLRGRAVRASAAIVAPATFNTINKLAAGISDNFALGVLAEHIGTGVPVVILPFLNTALASRLPLQRSVASLRSEGVRVLLGPREFEPHPPGKGGERIADFPWQLAVIEALKRMRIADVSLK